MIQKKKKKERQKGPNYELMHFDDAVDGGNYLFVQNLIALYSCIPNGILFILRLLIFPQVFSLLLFFHIHIFIGS